MFTISPPQSHGSLTIRFGALVFGAGALAYFTMEFISFLEIKTDSPCFRPVAGVNVVLAIVFVVLQTYLVFVYPRLNLAKHPFVDRYKKVTFVLFSTDQIVPFTTLCSIVGIYTSCSQLFAFCSTVGSAQCTSSRPT